MDPRQQVRTIRQPTLSNQSVVDPRQQVRTILYKSIPAGSFKVVRTDDFLCPSGCQKNFRDVRTDDIL